MTAIELKLTVKRLKKQIAERDAMIADRDATIARLAGDVAKLQSAVEQLLAQRRSGHRVPEGQGLLFGQAQEGPPDESADVEAESEGEPEQGDDQGEPEPPARKKGTKRTPGKVDTAGLPREQKRHELPEEERVDPATGKPLIAIGEKVTEELHFERSRLVVIEHVQILYGLPPEEAEQRKIEPVRADVPPRPLENCAASAVLLAWLLVQKYGNHLPLYRQESIFEREGLRLSRKTLCDWALAAAELLEPIVEWLMAKIRAGPVMQLDDTPVMCQGGRGEPNFQAYLWTFVNPDVGGVAYRFTSGRASALLRDELGDFSGHLVGDGFSGNRAAAEKAPGDIVLCGCWAHTIRKFRDAASEAAGTARLFQDDIKRLYEVEREADEAELSPQARTKLRRQKARPILATIFDRVRRMRDDFSDAGLMAKAIGYVRGQRRQLRNFLRDGRIPLDNNACERAIRPIAIGRKNWLFAGSMRGGRAAAIVYTLIESCRQASVNMIDYLADVLDRVSSHPASRVDELVPANWAATRASKLAAK